MQTGSLYNSVKSHLPRDIDSQGVQTPRGHDRLLDNSQIRQLADCQLADWSTRGLDNSRTSQRQLTEWTSRGLDKSRILTMWTYRIISLIYV